MATGTIKHAIITYSNTGHPHIYGQAYGHPKFEDGMPIMTSRIVGVKEYPNWFEVETKHSLYKLLKGTSADDVGEKLREFSETVDMES